MQLEAEAVHAAGAGNVCPHTHACRLEAFGQLWRGGLVFDGLVQQALQLLAGRLVAGSHGHVDFLRCELFFLGAGFSEACREGQAVRFFQHLRGLDGAARFPLAQPYLALQ